MSSNYNSGFNWASDSSGGGGGASEEYVNAKVAQTLQDAKDYTDEMTEVLTKVSRYIYVNGDWTGEQEDGTLAYPYKTINQAISDTTPGVTTVIQVMPGTYTEYISIESKSNLTLNAVGTIGQYRTSLTGGLFISGTTARIGINNFEFNGTSILSEASGPVYIENCSFGGTLTISPVTSYTRMDNCFFDKNVTASNHTVVDLYNCQFESISTLSVASGTTIINNCNNVSVAHSGGTVISRGDTNFIDNGAGSAITSTADLSESNNALFLLGGSTFNGTTYGKINKTGTCPYCITVFAHEPKLDVLTGTKIDSGLHGTDIYAHFTPLSYIPTDDTIQAHLIGLDGKLNTALSNPTDTTKLMSSYNGTWNDISVPKFGYGSGTEYRVVYVDNQQSIDSSKQDGSWGFPFANINDAISKALGSGPTTVIHIRGGIYSEDVDIPSFRDNIAIIGEDNPATINSSSSYGENQGVQCLGNWTIAAQGVRVSNVKFATVTMTVDSNSTYTSNFFDNCFFSNRLTDDGTSGGNVIIQNSAFSGLNIISPNIKVDLFNCNNTGPMSSTLYTKNILSVSGGMVSIRDCNNINLRHNGGRVYTYGSTYFTGGESGSAMGDDVRNGIYSTATTGGLYLMGGSMWGIDIGSLASATPSWKKITKTGTCEFTIGAGFSYDPTICSFTGTRTMNGTNAVDVIVAFQPTDYTPADARLESHLAAIDDALSRKLG